MSKWTLLLGTGFLVVAVFILIFAEGARRWYSGGFLLALGLAIMGNSRLGPGS